MTIWELLTAPLAKQSILAIVVAAAVGSILGQSVRLLFSNVLAHRINRERIIRDGLRTYKRPLYLNGLSLLRRLTILPNLQRQSWTAKRKSYHFRLETLYLLSAYFGWCAIIERESLIVISGNSHALKRFYNYFYRIHSALSSNRELLKSDAFDETAATNSVLPRVIVTAIGEMMIVESQDNTKHRVKSFTEFVQDFRKPEIKHWIDPLDKFIEVSLVQSEHRRFDPSFNRLVLLTLHLRSFLNYLGAVKSPNHSIAPDELDMLHPDLQQIILKTYARDSRHHSIRSYLLYHIKSFQGKFHIS